MGIARKLDALTLIARVFRENHVEWALGGSTLLYLKGISRQFGDIDIMVKREDLTRIVNAIQTIVNEFHVDNMNNSKFDFCITFNLNGTEIELFDGIHLPKENGEAVTVDFNSTYVYECINLSDETIPLMSCETWYKWYGLIGRTEKVQLLYNQKHLW